MQHALDSGRVNGKARWVHVSWSRHLYFMLKGKFGKPKDIHHSRGTFPILSRDPSFQKTIKKPGETAGF